MKRILQFALLLVLATPAWATTWWVRADGGSRYEATDNPSGRCNGQADAPDPGSGTNQACAYGEAQYLWDVGNSPGGVGPDTIAWVIAGGDTVVIRAGQYRIGWDATTGGANRFCPFIGNTNCYNPTIPSGSSGAHTRILSGCAHDNNCTPINSNYPYGTINETQLYGGFGLGFTLDLSGAIYVDVDGFDITTHNAISSGNPSYPNQCVTGISSMYQYPATCQNSQPYDDYGLSGIKTDNTTSHVTMTDLYIHGFNSSGIQGPIGGPITMTRVFVGFNPQTAWNFTDIAGDIPDAAGSSINASYVTMIGSGCSEEYPVVHTQFPAKGCWDANTGAGGDTWSGQDTELDSFICDHCVNIYNTKDAYIGPHTQILNNVITNSFWYGNMGAQLKWGQAPSGTILFQNNLVVGNCYRMSEAIPGARQDFNIGTGLPGSYLDTFCRAGGATFATLTRAGSENDFFGNTIIGAASIIFQYGCGYYSPGNVFHAETDCDAVPNSYIGNNFLGYTDPIAVDPPALYYCNESPCHTFVTSATNNSQFGLKGGTTSPCTAGCSTADPLLLNEPAQTWPGTEAGLDVFDAFAIGNSFYPTGSSPLIAAGTPIGGLTADYYGTSRTNPPWIGAVNSLTTPVAATPTFSPVAGSYTGTQTVTISTTTTGDGCTLVWNTTNAQSGGNLTGTSTTNPLTVSSSETVYAQAQGCTDHSNSVIGSAAYTISSGSGSTLTILGTVTAIGSSSVIP